MKTVIVSGATGNLGQAVVSKFLEKKFHVAGTIRRMHNTDEHHHANFQPQVVDVKNEEASAEFVQSVIARHGQLDAAILTVGGFVAGNISNTGTKDLITQIDLNFISCYNVARPVFLYMMKQRRGRIFLVGSRAGLDAKDSNGVIAYGLSKSLIFRFAELMNVDGKKEGVHTSVIVPGTIDTPENRKSMPEADFSKWTSPESIAEIIYDSFESPFNANQHSVIKV
ncbi:MAG: SDR family NAD(P)-dependent oxidoreductase [Chitinophagaceae bacterium]|nr:SDR family NAD(P)-dependent oxidoreductase [Chitinophagaceae bacterium]